MKIEQQPKFAPITITLETAEEAATLWRVIRMARHSSAQLSAEDLSFCINLISAFSNDLQLGGKSK
ncbi:MAG: hypothetical protein WC736_14790 [Gallionella sp.]|jgi:hypothetical protein